MSFRWLIIEIAGTIAFAVSGALVALNRDMDLFGISVLAVLTAMGGGLIRDVLLGVTPPTSLCQPAWLFLSLLGAAGACVACRIGRWTDHYRKTFMILYNLSDTVGLAAFTATGTTMGLKLYPGYHFILPVMMGLLTAVGGGIMRDLMAQRVPVVLSRDVYASAALAGSLILCVAWGKMPPSWSIALCCAVVCLLRLFALLFGWQLYHPGDKKYGVNR